jgi:hypothetical protein
MQIHDAVAIEPAAGPGPLRGPDSVLEQARTARPCHRVHEQVQVIDQPVPDERAYEGAAAADVQRLGRVLQLPVGGTAAGLHLIAWLPDGADEHATAKAARQAGVGLHELHRHCTTMAPSPPALLLGFALPTGSELEAATKLLAASLR